MPEDVVVSEGTTEPSAEESVQDAVQKDIEEWKSKDPHQKLVKQVQEDLAGGLEGLDSEPSQGDKTTEESFSEEKAKIAKTLKERSKVFTQREEAKKEAEYIKSEALKLQAQAQQMYQQVQEQAQWLANLRKDPLRALKQAGLDPEEFILSIARDGTQEGEVSRELRELRQWKEEQARREEEQKEQYKAFQKQQELKERQEYRSFIENKFIEGTGGKDNLKKALEYGIVSHKTLISEGDRVADEYKAITGKYAELDDILEYLDEQYGIAYRKLKGTPEQPKVTPPRVKAKTLSLDDASERRATEAADKDEIGQDRLDKAKQAVKALMSRRGQTKEQ